MSLENFTYPFGWNSLNGKHPLNPVLRGGFPPEGGSDWQIEAAQKEGSPRALETSFFHKLRLIMHDAVDVPRR